VSVEAESHFLPMDGGREIHLRRFLGDGPMLLLLHGAIENGRIFHSRSGRGLAPWLAQQGYDVWIMDLGGRGESRPPIGRGSDYSQTDSIVTEIPEAMDYMAEQRPGVELHWLAHSWGGVMMTAVLARFPERIRQVTSLCFFGSKRRVRVWNWQRLVYVDLIWCWLSPVICWVMGYLPARKLKFGSDDESRLTHAHGKAWVRQSEWIDPEDGFDYAAALRELSLPRALYFAGAADPALGHPEDVKRLMDESGEGEKHFHLLSKDRGYSKDYGHINMLTAPSAREDHFPEVLKWLQRQGD